MGMYEATVSWRLADGDQFAGNKYSRLHQWSFDGGVTVPGSPSPQTVPSPLSDTSAVDPEEALVASLSSCHMLFFLAIASKRGFSIESYEDKAQGELVTEDGKTWMKTFTLRPAAKFVGDTLPTPADIDDLHHAAHKACYIGNSLKGEVVIEPQQGQAQ